MYSTTVYLYQQLIRAVLVDVNGQFFTARYQPVYAQTLTVNKGVDNALLFEFINQDQKPVNITGSTFVFRLLNQAGNELLIEKPMETLSATTGRVKVVLESADVDGILAQPASYSIERTQGNYRQAVFTDANAGARGVCTVVDSVLPEFIASGELTVPDIYGKNQYVGTAPTGWPDWALYPQPINTIRQTEFYSSYIPYTGKSVTTVALDLVHYTGTLKLQAADNYQSVWYDVSESEQYLDQTGTVHLSAVGFYPLLRVALNNSIGYDASATATVVDGVVTDILVNNPGAEYQAPPYVQILGNGAGAAAAAVLEPGGTISSITVTAGGSGYLPLQFLSPISATVVITNGVVERIRYR
jgi:hypothetical protein